MRLEAAAPYASLCTCAGDGAIVLGQFQVKRIRFTLEPSRDYLSLCSAATHSPRPRSPFLTSGEGACTAWRHRSAGARTEAARQRNSTTSFRAPPTINRTGRMASGAALNHGD